MTKRVPQTLRQQVRLLAGGRCEYCGKPEGISFYSHHADHIIPPLHGGENDLENLAWACLECNTNKRDNVASYDAQTKQLTPLFNPRIHQWEDHFQMESGYIDGLSAIGRVTVRVLNMNDSLQVEFRQRMLRIGRW